MRVILNQDVPNLGELGDVKDVAPGYARNFLFPRSMAFAHNVKTVALFEKRKAEIDALRAAKRAASSGLKEKIEAEELVLILPAGANGKLYGAVTGHNVVDEMAKRGIEIDRKKVEVPGHSIKSIGNYKVLVRLYEKDEATLRVSVQGQPVKVESKEESAPKPRRRRNEEERAQANTSVPEAPAPEAKA
jgi:large subunit ribosomal protein L9